MYIPTLCNMKNVLLQNLICPSCIPDDNFDMLPNFFWSLESVTKHWVFGFFIVVINKKLISNMSVMDLCNGDGFYWNHFFFEDEITWTNSCNLSFGGAISTTYLFLSPLIDVYITTRCLLFTWSNWKWLNWVIKVIVTQNFFLSISKNKVVIKRVIFDDNKQQVENFIFHKYISTYFYIQ